MKRIIIMILLLGLISLAGCISEPNYYYVGRIIDMEGGSSSNLLILKLDTIGKVPYTTQEACSNKIRIGQEVYKKSNSDYLWVKYEEDKFC